MSVKRDLFCGKRDLICGKRDLICGKRDLFCGKRDLICGKRDLTLAYLKHDHITRGNVGALQIGLERRHHLQDAVYECIECVLILQKVFSYYRTCSLKDLQDGVDIAVRNDRQNVFSYLECVLCTTALYYSTTCKMEWMLPSGTTCTSFEEISRARCLVTVST